MIEGYIITIQKLLERVLREQREEMAAAAKLMAETVKADGLIYIYGSGHAHMAAEDLFYRAGGLACVRPIFIEPLMLHEGAVNSSALEKAEGLMAEYLDVLPVEEKDLFIVVSSSGRNATPIDAALFAKTKGCSLITISSRDYSLIAPSGHSCKKRLMELGNINLDNYAPVGDACLTYPGVETAFSPVSSVVNLSILQAVTGECIRYCADWGMERIPVFKSGNMAGGPEYNQAVIAAYKDRVPYLR